MSDAYDVVESLARLTLFADLTRPQLQAVAHSFDEAWFPAEERILRQGFTGTGLYVVLEGETAIRIDGVERARLTRGDHFGEVAILLGEPPGADVVAITPLRCLVIPGSEVEGFLLAHPKVMFRMLQAEARRLQSANVWQS